jgi:hypothetical protein
MRRAYPTDLSDAEWNNIQPHMPASKGYESGVTMEPRRSREENATCW